MKSTLECTLCGTELVEEYEYCPECGETLSKKE